MYRNLFADKFVPGVYAVSVSGALPLDVVRELKVCQIDFNHFLSGYFWNVLRKRSNEYLHAFYLNNLFERQLLNGRQFGFIESRNLLQTAR